MQIVLSTKKHKLTKEKHLRRGMGREKKQVKIHNLTLQRHI